MSEIGSIVIIMILLTNWLLTRQVQVREGQILSGRIAELEEKISGGNAQLLRPLSDRVKQLEDRAKELTDQSGRSSSKFNKISSKIADLEKKVAQENAQLLHLSNQVRVLGTQSGHSSRRSSKTKGQSDRKRSNFQATSPGATQDNENSLLRSEQDKAIRTVKTNLISDDDLMSRLSKLEIITKARIGWLRDPYIGHKTSHRCINKREVAEHFICMDDFPPEYSGPERCVVYDMGLHHQPTFGIQLAREFPQCDVHSFDPSPVAVAHMDSIQTELNKMPNYHFHKFGVGGVDGTVDLYEYNWDQVGSVRIPIHLTDDCGWDEDTVPHTKADMLRSKPKNVSYYENRCREDDNSGFAHSNGRAEQQSRVFTLPVKTLQTIMRELGHKVVDVMKMDVEGSEYMFLESAIDDFDCPPIRQMSIEWHHYSFDMRYGGGAAPEINTIAAYLYERCNIKQYQIDFPDGGFVDDHLWARNAGLQLRYNTGSYMHVKT